MDKRSYSDKTFALLGQLPDFCQTFIYGKAVGSEASTRYEYARDIKAFFDWLYYNHEHFCDKKPEEVMASDMAEISPDDINRYLSTLKSCIKERTIARKKAAISVLFAYLCSSRGLKNNPMAASEKIKIKDEELVYLTIQEQEKFLDVVKNGTGMSKKQLKFHEHYKNRDYLLYSLLLDTGLRVSELAGINIKDIDLEECNVLVTRKGGNSEFVYYSDDTKNLLEEFILQRKTNGAGLSSALFVTEKGTRLSVRAIEDMTKKYAALSLPQKADKITPHKMRSSYAMSLYEASGNDLLLVQKALSHKNITTTNIYAKASDDAKIRARNLISDMKKRG